MRGLGGESVIVESVVAFEVATALCEKVQATTAWPKCSRGGFVPAMARER